MWDVVVEDWLAQLVADTDLVAVLGADIATRITMAGSSLPVTVPSVQYLPIYDFEAENFNRFALQVDFWARGSADARLIESRLRVLTHRDVSYELGGRSIWSRFLDARSIQYPREPGVIHRSLDFEFETLRSRRQPAPS